MILKYNWSILNQIRQKTTITSFKQWKDLLVFKRHDGKHVWNLPKFIPHEFGFRRIARKPPFFKERKFVFPKLVKDHDPGRHVMYNRDVYVRYDWVQKCRDFHQLKDYINKNYKGVNVVGIPVEDESFEVVDDSQNVLLELNTHKDIDNLFKS